MHIAGSLSAQGKMIGGGGGGGGGGGAPLDSAGMKRLTAMETAVQKLDKECVRKVSFLHHDGVCCVCSLSRPPLSLFGAIM